MPFQPTASGSFGGEPVLVLKRSVMPKLLLCLTLLPAALGLMALAGALALGSEHELAGAAISASFGLAAALPFFFLFREELGRRTLLYADGIVQERRGNETQLPYDEISEVWLRAIRVQAGGLIGLGIVAAVNALSNKKGALLNERTTNITVRLQGNKRSLRITSNDRGVARAFEEILARLNPRIVHETLQTIASGNPARFGKVSLSAEGVTMGNKAPVPLGDIERLYVESGRLLLKRSGKWTKSSVAVSSVPNVFALLEAHAALTEAPIDIPKPGGLATRIFA